MIVYKCDLCKSEFNHNDTLPPINTYVGYKKEGGYMENGVYYQYVYNHETCEIKHVCVDCRVSITEFINSHLCKS